MRILDINNNKLSPQEIDLTKGYLEEDTIFIKSHEMIPEQPGKSYYWPNIFYFKDGSSYQVKEIDDPHIKVIDAANYKFDWNPLGEEAKEVQGIDLSIVEIQPHIEKKEAWDEYENILRYKEYSKEVQKYKPTNKTKNFVLTPEDLLLLIADLINEEEV